MRSGEEIRGGELQSVPVQCDCDVNGLILAVKPPSASTGNEQTKGSSNTTPADRRLQARFNPSKGVFHKHLDGRLSETGYRRVARYNKLVKCSSVFIGERRGVQVASGRRGASIKHVCLEHVKLGTGGI